MIKLFAINNLIELSITGEDLIASSKTRTIGTNSGIQQGLSVTVTTEKAIEIRNILIGMDLDNYNVNHKGLTADERLAENLGRMMDVERKIDVDIAPGHGILPLCYKCSKQHSCQFASTEQAVTECPLLMADAVCEQCIATDGCAYDRGEGPDQCPLSASIN